MIKWTKVKCSLLWSLLNIDLRQKVDSDFQFSWSRGDNKGETDVIKPNSSNILVFNSNFEVPCTMFINKADGTLRPKKLKLTLKRFLADDKQKIFGKLTIDVCTFYGVKEVTKISKEMESGRGTAPVLEATFLLHPIGDASDAGGSDLNDISFIGETDKHVPLKDWDVTETSNIDDEEEEESDKKKKKKKSKKKSKKDKDKDKEKSKEKDKEKDKDKEKKKKSKKDKDKNKDGDKLKLTEDENANSNASLDLANAGSGIVFKRETPTSDISFKKESEQTADEEPKVTFKRESEQDDEPKEKLEEDEKTEEPTAEAQPGVSPESEVNAATNENETTGAEEKGEKKKKSKKDKKKSDEEKKEKKKSDEEKKEKKHKDKKDKDKPKDAEGEKEDGDAKKHSKKHSKKHKKSDLGASSESLEAANAYSTQEIKEDTESTDKIEPKVGFKHEADTAPQKEGNDEGIVFQREAKIEEHTESHHDDDESSESSDEAIIDNPADKAARKEDEKTMEISPEYFFHTILNQDWLHLKRCSPANTASVTPPSLLIDATNTTGKPMFPPAFFPIVAMFQYTHFLDAVDQENDHFDSCLSVFIAEYPNMPDQTTLKRAQLSFLLYAFVYSQINSISASNTFRFDKTKGEIFLKNMHDILIDHLDKYLNKYVVKTDVLVNRFSTATFEFNHLLADFKEVIQHDLKIFSKFASESMNKIVKERFFNLFGTKIINKIIESPSRFNFTNSAIWNSFLSAVENDERVSFLHLKDVISSLIMAQSLSSNPSLVDPVCKNISPRLVAFIIANYHKDQNMLEDIKVKPFLEAFKLEKPLIDVPYDEEIKPLNINIDWTTISQQCDFAYKWNKLSKNDLIVTSYSFFSQYV